MINQGISHLEWWFSSALYILNLVTGDSCRLLNTYHMPTAILSTYLFL